MTRKKFRAAAPIIKKHTGKRRLSAACRLLNVRRRYCAWAAREQERPVRVRRDEALTVKIQNIFYERKRVYGARKIQWLLRREDRMVGRKRIRRLILQAGHLIFTRALRLPLCGGRGAFFMLPAMLRPYS